MARPRAPRAPLFPSGPAVRLRAGGAPIALAGLSGVGERLASDTQAAIEESLRVDLRGVRVHGDVRAQTAARRLSARAFTYGNQIFLGAGERQTDLGLMAHESAHVVQQQGAPTLQRWTAGPTDSFEQEAQRASAAVVRGEPFAVQLRTAGPQVQRLGLGSVLDFFAGKANIIPGFRLFTIVLGFNPINGSPVARSAANILRGLIELLPVGGLITQALENSGIFDKVGSWVERQFQTLGGIGGAIKQALKDFLDGLGLSDALDLGSAWGRAKRIVNEPIDRLVEFGKGLVADIIKFVKEAILRPLAKLAEGTRGYDLLKAVLGEDPVTGDPYPRTAETLIGGFMKLIGQEEVWENIKKSNAVARAWAWFQGALSGLIGFVKQLPKLFINAFRALELVDIVLVPRAFLRIAAVFGGFLGDFLRWAGNAVWNLLQIIFEVVAPGAMPYLKKAGAAFKTILKNPIAFVGNLVKAGILGFQRFANNIGKHLKAALISWLTGSLASVYIPKTLEFREILMFALSVLGLTWANIRGKLVKVLGETPVKALETGFKIVATLVTEGPAAAWEQIKEQLGNLKDMVMGAIMDFVIDTVVKKAVAKIISFLVPGGAFIQAIITIYDTILVFINKLKTIIQVATAFLDSIIAIAAGQIAGAAGKVESVLAGLLVLAINFLAGFAGLGKIADKVMKILNTKVRAPIDKALDKVIAWIVNAARKSGKLLVGAAKKLFNWDFAKVSFAEADGHSHSILINVSGGVARLKIASIPLAAEEFLEIYINKRKDEAFKSNKASLINDIRNHIKQAQEVVVAIDKLKNANPMDPNLEKLQQNLLKRLVDLSTLLTKLTGRNLTDKKAREKYKLEGLAGTFASIPQLTGDDLTPDHQPQAAILLAAAKLLEHHDEGELKARAFRRANAGYAINLHENRHKRGRTFGHKGAKTKKKFLSEIEKKGKGLEKKDMPRLIVEIIKKHLERDVKTMKREVKNPPSHAMWSDVMKLDDPTGKENKKTVDDIRKRIEAGEDLIAKQPIDSLIQ